MPNTQKPTDLSRFENANSKLPNNFKFLKKIGRRMKIIREVRGISLSKLSELSKIDERDLQKYEAGIDKNFAIDDLITISDILNIDSFQFFM